MTIPRRSTDMQPKVERTPVAFFNITTDRGTDLGWVGFCAAYNESMLPALFHAGGEDGARERAKTDPPKPVSSHQGMTYVPYTWLIQRLRDPSYLPAAKAMDVAARRAHKATQEKAPSFSDGARKRAGKMSRPK